MRELGVYSEVLPSDTPASVLRSRKAIIISGGPASVYAPGSPQVDPAIFSLGVGVLGICYGQQLMAYHLGGIVAKGERGEYGFATLEVSSPGPLLQGTEGRQQVWMSHFDTVAKVPDGFDVLAATSTCPIAAVASPDRKLYGVQFHPEVVHTRHGRQILSNFLFDICRLPSGLGSAPPDTAA